MIRKILFITIISTLGFISCQKDEFINAYTDPSKIAETSVEKQFTGFLKANSEYILPDYWHYFVAMRITHHRYNQTIGWVNGENQYLPGGAAVSALWDNYFTTLAQYRELENVYNSKSTTDQADFKIYMMAAKVHLYEYTQKIVDLFGDIPFSKAGLLGRNGGDYNYSYPEYEKADAIYKVMLDDLKSIADEMSTIQIKSGIVSGFKTQDFILKGDLMAWRRYANSLRMRILTRVSGVSAFSARYKSEVGEILNNPTKYPIVSKHSENVQITVHDIGSPIHSKNFRTGLEDWNGNLASKIIVDNMVTNKDPRINFILEPGTMAAGKFQGLDPLATPSAQDAAILTNTLTIYNRSTLSRNQFFPGMLFGATEVSLLAAEFYLGNNDDAKAKASYEAAIRQSAEFYMAVRKISNDNTVPAPKDIATAEMDAYLKENGVDWSKATTSADKLKRIITQKWLHMNVIQPHENWAENRRTDVLGLTFWTDPNSTQKQPPVRWFYPNSEQVYNSTNYATVKGNDTPNNKLFWDLK